MSLRGSSISGRQAVCGPAARGSGAVEPRPCAGVRAGAASVRLVVGLSLLLVFDAFVNLLAMHSDIFRRVDTHTRLISLYAQDGDRYVVADHHSFSHTSGKDQHSCLLDTHGLPLRSVI